MLIGIFTVDWNLSVMFYRFNGSRLSMVVSVFGSGLYAEENNVTE